MVNSSVSHEKIREAAIHESANKKTLPFRARVLERAIKCTLGDRQDAYGPPSDALFLAAEFIRLYKESAKDKYCAAHDEAISLALLKLARIACGSVGHTDNYVDGAAYFAIAAECQYLHTQLKPLLATSDRLAEVDKRYKAAIELEVDDKAVRDRGMLNPYAAVNKKI